MINSKSESQLKRLGLNSYEVKIWVALLSSGVSTAGELSGTANTPRSRSYDVLESLEKKGFVVMKAGKPIKYVAVSPKDVVERVKKNVADVAKEEVKVLSNLKNEELIKELNEIHSQGNEMTEPTDLSGSLRGRNNLYNHIDYMLRKAEKNVVISTTPAEFVLFVEQFSSLFEKIKIKNVKVKIFTQLNEKTKKYMNKIKQFVDVKHTDSKSRFCIVDGKEIIFMILNDEQVHPTYDVGIWVNTPLAKDLERFF